MLSPVASSTSHNWGWLIMSAMSTGCATWWLWQSSLFFPSLSPAQNRLQKGIPSLGNSGSTISYQLLQSQLGATILLPLLLLGTHITDNGTPWTLCHSSQPRALFFHEDSLYSSSSYNNSAFGAGASNLFWNSRQNEDNKHFIFPLV